MANYAKDCGGERYRRLVCKVFEAVEKIKQPAVKEEQENQLNEIKELIHS
jgi:hypothetical protein